MEMSWSKSHKSGYIQIQHATCSFIIRNNRYLPDKHHLMPKIIKFLKKQCITTTTNDRQVLVVGVCSSQFADSLQFS